MDLRGHGASYDSTPSPSHPRYPTPTSFHHCALDVYHSLPPQHHHQPPTAVMGHSWGGRIALELALHMMMTTTTMEGDTAAATATMPTFWLLDTVPGQAHPSVVQVLKAVEQLDLSLYSEKKQVAQALMGPPHRLDPGIAQWLAVGLQQRNSNTAARWQWSFDVDMVMTEVLPEFEHHDFMGHLERVLVEGGHTKVHLVRGGKNASWGDDPQLLPRLESLTKQFPQSFHLHVLPKAGHWVHTDDLPGLIALWKQFNP